MVFYINHSYRYIIRPLYNYKKANFPHLIVSIFCLLYPSGPGGRRLPREEEQEEEEEALLQEEGGRLMPLLVQVLLLRVDVGGGPQDMQGAGL